MYGAAGRGAMAFGAVPCGDLVLRVGFGDPVGKKVVPGTAAASPTRQGLESSLEAGETASRRAG